jgi:hypothetical protein
MPVWVGGADKCPLVADPRAIQNVIGGHANQYKMNFSLCHRALLIRYFTPGRSLHEGRSLVAHYFPRSAKSNAVKEPHRPP